MKNTGLFTAFNGVGLDQGSTVKYKDVGQTPSTLEMNLITWGLAKRLSA